MNFDNIDFCKRCFTVCSFLCQNLKDYPHQYWFAAQKEGYSGVALLSRTEPLSVDKGLGEEEFDCEGRLITAEFPAFYLATSYVPNAGRKLVTLDKRMQWDPVLRKHLKVSVSEMERGIHGH